MVDSGFFISFHFTLPLNWIYINDDDDNDNDEKWHGPLLIRYRDFLFFLTVHISLGANDDFRSNSFPLDDDDDDGINNMIRRKKRQR